MEIIKALANCHLAIKVNGRALYPLVSLSGFSPKPGQFGIQVATHATVRFEVESIRFGIDGRAPTEGKELVLELSGDIWAVEQSLISFLGEKTIDDLLKL